MQTKPDIFLNQVGAACCLGSNLTQLKQGLVSSHPDFMTWTDEYGTESIPVGKYVGTLPQISLSENKWCSRNNQLAQLSFEQIQQEVELAIKTYGRNRVGVIIGTSTSGIGDAETALTQHIQGKGLPADYHYSIQEMANTAEFIAKLSGATGPTYAVSTACSSGAKAIATAKRLIQADVCDVIIAGGVDSLCQLTLQGFSSLEAVSKTVCNPFSSHRDGINIGEASALFVISKEKKGVRLSGVGESSDAYHISAPHPKGNGAEQAMKTALDDAKIKASEIDYINLHGTATRLNDEMESLAVNRVFPESTLCSSTKALTGHTLGAAGALEAAICWLALTEQKFVPQHHWDEQVDPELPRLNFVVESSSKTTVNRILSNSFAFGGNNIALIMERLS